ncbi:hypothetical protein C2G38_2031742 [Gigaspora rosea]|uniref:Uncharacterized protein n=1 Tax=Gigaspora rosea TaxID=44941 RepID=A0A397VUH4_9GLOM|nr:hypothetical protein C2G38_2031742 [Gigaspora rosea]
MFHRSWIFSYIKRQLYSANGKWICGSNGPKKVKVEETTWLHKYSSSLLIGEVSNSPLDKTNRIDRRNSTYEMIKQSKHAMLIYYRTFSRILNLSVPGIVPFVLLIPRFWRYSPLYDSGVM